NWAGDMIDAYSHAQFLAQHREAVMTALKSVIAAVFSPTGSLVTLVLGGGYLLLDRRAARLASVVPLAKVTPHPEPQKPNTLVEAKENGQPWPQFGAAPFRWTVLGLGSSMDLAGSDLWH